MKSVISHGSVSKGNGGNERKNYFVNSNKLFYSNLKVTAEQSLRIPQHTVNKYAEKIRGKKRDKAVVVTQTLVKKYLMAEDGRGGRGWEVKEEGILFLVDTYDALKFVMFDIDTDKKCWECNLLSESGVPYGREKQGNSQIVLTEREGTHGLSVSLLWDVDMFNKAVENSVSQKLEFLRGLEEKKNEALGKKKKKKKKPKKKKKKKRGLSDMSAATASKGRKFIQSLPALVMTPSKLTKKRRKMDHTLMEYLEEETMHDKEELAGLTYEKQFMLVINSLAENWREKVDVEGIEFMDDVTVVRKVTEIVTQQKEEPKPQEVTKVEVEEVEGEGDDEEEKVEKVTKVEKVEEIKIEETIEEMAKVEEVEEKVEEVEVKKVEEVVLEGEEDEEEEKEVEWVIGVEIVVPEYPVHFLDEIKLRLQEFKRDRGFEEVQIMTVGEGEEDDLFKEE